MSVCCWAEGAFSLGSVLLGPLLWQRPNNEVMRSFVRSVARQRPVGNNGVVFSLESVLRIRCRGNIVLLIQPELQKGEVVKSRHT
jgi:hypothetical protein